MTSEIGAGRASTLAFLGVLLATVAGLAWLGSSRPAPAPSSARGWSQAGGTAMLQSLQADAQALLRAQDPTLRRESCRRLAATAQDAREYDPMAAGPASGAWGRTLADLADAGACGADYRADAEAGLGQVANMQAEIH